jgi:hypothetical protein
VIVIAAIAIIAGIAVYYYFQVGTPQTPASLNINLITLSGKSSSSSTLNVSISNVGGEAKGVSVTLSSDAFGQVSTNSVDVPANQTVYAQGTAQIKDVTNGEYRVTINCSYNGAGTVNTNDNSQFYVLPSIDIVNVRWLQVGFIITSDKSTIGPNDNTTIFFKITSHSNNWTYTGLSATATTLQGTQGLTMTPSSLALSNIGPQGTSTEYAFQLSTHDTPYGKYVITIHVFSDQHEVASDSSKTLTVSS